MKSFIAFLIIVLLPVSIFASDKINPHELNYNRSGEKNNCIMCHIPEENRIDVQKPVWGNKNEEKSGVNSINNDNEKISQKAEISKMCLSCHDGSIINSEHSYNLKIEGDESINVSDSRFNHPVGISYTSSKAMTNKKLFNPDITPSGLGGTISQDLLNNGVLECTSCHFPHFDSSESENKSLVINNAGSRLCLTCHNM